MKPPAELTQVSISTAIVRLSVPIILANLLQTGYAITDYYWVGQLSAEAVAAVSLSFPINFLLIAVGGGLPIAGTVLIAQYRGRGDNTAMNHVAAQTMLMVFIVSLVLSIGGYFVSEPLMRFMGAGPDVLRDATRFTQVTFLGFQVLTGTLRGAGDTVAPMLLAIVFQWVLRFPLAYLFSKHADWGLDGIWWSFTVSNILATAAAVLWFLRGDWKRKKLLDEIELEKQVRDETVIDEGVQL